MTIDAQDGDFKVESWTVSEIRELGQELRSEGKIIPVFYDEGEKYE